MKKKKLKIKWYNIITLSIILICSIGLIVTMKDIVMWKLDSNKIEQQIEEIQEIVEIEKAEETEEIEIIEQVEEIPKANPYWII